MISLIPTSAYDIKVGHRILVDGRIDTVRKVEKHTVASSRITMPVAAIYLWETDSDFLVRLAHEIVYRLDGLPHPILGTEVGITVTIDGEPLHGTLRR